MGLLLLGRRDNEVRRDLVGVAVLSLFMIWLYVSRLILLVGAEVSFYHRNPQHLMIRASGHAPDGRILEQIAVSIMFPIADHFSRNKEPWAETTLVPSRRSKTPVAGGFDKEAGGKDKG